jgi:hypothetical protein
LNKSNLTFDDFVKMFHGQSLTVSRPFSFKKVNHERNSKQQHLKPFSIMHLTNISRTVNMSAWAGRLFKNNSSVPYFSNLEKYL